MPNVTSPAHLTMTVSGTSYPLIVDPNSVAKTDIVDFAPRAVSGTPTYSTLGLYLDIAQEGFNHGFGQWEFTEPKSYSYAGHGVDARHGFIQLYTEASAVGSIAAGWYVNKMIEQNSIPLMATSDGIAVIKPSDGAIATYLPGVGGFRDVISNGKYAFASCSGQLRKIYIAHPTSANATSATFSTAGFEDVNQWQGGKAWVFDGTGASAAVNITASTATVVTATWGGGTPDTSSWILLIHTTGNAGNTPDNFYKMAVFGGSVWAIEYGTNYLHFWSATNGSTAEGHGTTDASVVTCGPVGHALQNLAGFQGQLWAFRSDGVWTINEQDKDALAYHTLDFSNEASTSNFATVIVWQGFIIFPVRNRLYKYRSGLQDITPPVWDEYPPYKQFGNFQTLFTCGKFLYCLGQSNAANAGETYETTTGFASLLATDGVGWHKLWDIPLTSPSHFGANIDPYNNYLYTYAYSAGTGYVYKIRLQPYSDLAYPTYPTTGTYNFYTSYYYFGMARIPKSFASVILHGDFTTGTSVAVYFRVDATQAWTSLGSFTSDMQEVDFPTATTGKRVQLKLVLATTNASNSPFIKAIILKVMLRPTVKYGLNCDVLVSDNLSDQNRKMLGLTAKQIKTALEAARNSVAPITLVDLWGTSGLAYLASVRFEVAAYEDSPHVQSIAHCTFVYV